VYSSNRIKYPLKRVDWDPDGDRNPQNRGEGALRNISSDANVSAEIKAEYYGADGKPIGTEVDIVRRLGPGKTGAFEVVYSGQQRWDIKYYRIVNLQPI
jgi:hypothetical protein